MPSLNGWWWFFLENVVYRMPEPPKRKRTKPMEVICIGLPRSGTESLQTALLSLGYDHTYHGWDIIYEMPNYAPQWVRLCRKKWFGSLDGNTTITAEDFDEIIGHSVAVTDAAGSAFAAELIAAYPEAKVVLNYRKDVNAWYRSVKETAGNGSNHAFFFVLSCLGRECFWSFHVYNRFLWPGLFRALDGDVKTGIARCGKWVARDHHNQSRGMVPNERLLEWCVEDGWQPLCEFLGKPVPDQPFPHVNTAAGGWKAQEARLSQRYMTAALQNLAIMGAVVVGAGAVYYKYIRQ